MGIKVFFNDSCSICRMEINHYKKISNSNLEWIDERVVMKVASRIK